MAIPRWIGGAGAIRQISTITMAGTWAAADTVTVKIGNCTLTCTIGTLVSTSDIAQVVMKAFNAASKTANLHGDESRNVGGQELPEFTGLVATASGVVVTITGMLGIPFTMTASESTAGDGTATGATSQSATGPNWFTNADNWSTGAIPVDGDTVRFDQPAPDCSYGLTELVTNTKKVDLVITTDFENRIGLPWYRAATAEAAGYVESRTRYLQMYDNTQAKDIRITKGDSAGVGGIYMLDLDNWDGDIFTADHCGSIKSEPSLQCFGGKSQEFYFGAGWGVLDPQESGVTTGHELDVILVGRKGGPDEELRFTIGPTVQFDTAIQGTFASGYTEIQTIIDQGGDEMALIILGGTVESKRAQAHAGITIKGGTYRWSGSGTAAGAIAVWSAGTLDLRGSGESQTYAGGVTLYGGAHLYKGGHTLTPTLTGCTDDDVFIEE